MTDFGRRYSSLIENIVQSGLKGNLQSREQVYSLIASEIEPTTEAIFNHCLSHRISQIELQANTTDQLTQVRAQRTLRTLKTVELEWQRYQETVNAQDLVAKAIFRITQAPNNDRLALLVETFSADQTGILPLPLLEQLASGLLSVACTSAESETFQAYATGIEQGIASWKAIDRHLISWLYAPQSLTPSPDPNKSPWHLWSMQPIGTLPRQLFIALHQKIGLEDWAVQCSDFHLNHWIETVFVLQRAQQGLIRWANQQPYEDAASKQLLSSLYLGFASTWIQLGQGLKRCISLNSQTRAEFSQVALTLGRQFLHQFTHHSKFPLYGNAQHTPQNQSLCDALQYLSQPLHQLNAQAEKARILTVVGSLVVLSGKCVEAEQLHQQALELAQANADTICSIANLNHLSRVATMQSQCSVAIEYAQRALVTARQIGDAPGEAHALMNLGTASAHQATLMEAPVRGYEAAMDYLMEAMDKAQELGEEHCEGLCANALANLCISIGHPAEGLRWLQTGFKAINTCGDIYLQARHFTSMAEACRQVSHPGDAIYAACLGLYYFDQINWREWRQPAALLTQLKQRLGEKFDYLLRQELKEIIQQIGADGFAQITHRLEEYGQLENC